MEAGFEAEGEEAEGCVEAGCVEVSDAWRMEGRLWRVKGVDFDLGRRARGVGVEKKR